MAGDGPGLAVLAVFADAGAQDGRAHGGGDAAHHMHRGAAGKIMEAQVRQPAAAPDPVAGDGVDDEGNEGAVYTVGLEVGALGHGAGNDSGGCGAEDGLEDHIAPHRQRTEIVIAPDQGIKAADEGSRAAEHDAEAHQPVDGRADAEVHQVLHQDVAGVFGPGQTRFTQGKARLHEKHHGRAP